MATVTVWRHGRRLAAGRGRGGRHRPAPGGSWYVPLKAPSVPTVRCSGAGGAAGTGVGLPDATGFAGRASTAVIVTLVPFVVPAMATVPPFTAAPSAGLVRASAGPSGSREGHLDDEVHGRRDLGRVRVGGGDRQLVLARDAAARPATRRPALSAETRYGLVARGLDRDRGARDRTCRRSCRWSASRRRRRPRWATVTRASAAGPTGRAGARCSRRTATMMSVSTAATSTPGVNVKPRRGASSGCGAMIIGPVGRAAPPSRRHWSSTSSGSRPRYIA